MEKSLILGGILVFILVAVNPVAGNDRDRPAPPQSGPDLNIGSVLIDIYRKVISPVDGDRCPSSPTCSAYSAEAFKKHGFFIGWMMTVDRLIHEGSEEAKVSPQIYQDGKWKVLDPVQNNDFWWVNHDR